MMKIVILDFFLTVDIKCPKELHDLQSDLPFLPGKMEINGHSNLACTLYDKKRIKKRGLDHILK